MKRFLFIMLVALFVGQMSYAQTSDTVTLRLRNGVSVTGQILEESNNSIKIKTVDGDIFIYRTNEVSRIEGGELSESETLQKMKKNVGNYGKFKGYRSFVDVTTAYSPNADNVRVGVTYIGGYNFGSCFFAGVGVGFAADAIQTVEEFRIPISLHLRSAFLKGRKVSPFLAISGGYEVSLTDYYSNCGFIEPTVGAEIRTRKKTAFSVGLTIPVMLDRTSRFGWSYYTSTDVYVGVKLGVSF